jgi:hypothetical protein
VAGFLTVNGAAEHLKLAPRSVRDLIYAGRLPSVRLGRVHFMSAADVEQERRRRLGLPLPPRRARPRRSTPRAVVAEPRPATVRRAPEQTARRQRAAERAALLERWLHASHRPLTPDLPFHVIALAEAQSCEACRRSLPSGARRLQLEPTDGHAAAVLCLTCGRRAVLRWADDRRRESVAARRLATDASFLQPQLQLEPAPSAVA